MGKGKEWDRKGEGRKGGKGKDDLHPTLFLGPGICTFFVSFFSEIDCVCWLLICLSFDAFRGFCDSKTVGAVGECVVLS